MNQRDRRLLDKQLRGYTQQPKDGIVILTAVAVFFAGVTLGGTIFSRQSDPTRTTSSNEAVISFLNNTLTREMNSK